MTQVVPSQTDLIAEASAVSLARYVTIIRYPECSFWGVARSSDRLHQCREIWSKEQRDNVARYLAEAQEEIETEVGYFLSPRYVVGSLADQPMHLDRYVDDQVYSSPITARWPKVIMAGVRGETVIATGATVDHTFDPAVIGPLATSVIDPDEVAIYHPDSDVQINPSAIEILAGQLTISIPRCRMVKEGLADNDGSGLDYTDVTNFEATVDLSRVYTDTSVNAELVSPHACSAFCLQGSCAEHTVTGCIYIVDGILGTLAVKPSNYVGGEWTSSGGSCCRALTRARLNYLAGMQTITRQAEDAIVRLAHAKMPTAPCGCENFLWSMDRFVPEVLTRERINCPFGLSNGSWTAWRYAQEMKQFRGSTF